MKIQVCEFPICPIHSNTKYCIRRAVGTVIPEKVKKVYNIPPRSKKRIVEQKEYVKIVKEMMAENDKCEIKEEGCQIFASGLHHQKKRSPDTFLDKKYLIRACSNCQSWAELFPLDAIKKGHSVSKFKK